MKQFFTYVKNDFISRLKSKKSKFKGVSYAFTLAEVLITLGVIGVVAAMTLPTLIQNHQKQTYVTGLKKAYSVLQNAFAQMALDEDVTDWRQTACYNVGLMTCIDNTYNYLDTSDNCVNNLQKTFNTINMEITGINSAVKATLTTSDGIKYSFGKGYVEKSESCPEAATYCSQDGFVAIDVDVNGDKGPNKWGRDRFEFYVNYDKNKIEPWGLSYYQTYCTPERLKQYDSMYVGGYCTAKVLIEGKMDY